MGYKTKQRLPYRAKLFVVVYIVDVDRKRSYQYGTDDGVPVSSSGADYFEIMKENAILNAIYKHFSSKGTPFNSRAKKQGGTYDYSALISKLEVKDYYFEYYGDTRYSFKTFNRGGKRYLGVKSNGKFETVKKFNYKRNELDNYEL